MYLRRLKEDDARFMLEWMHDISVTGFLKTDFSCKTFEDAYDFIIDSQKDDNNLNLAISNENDEYMGTVSLKHINEVNAEFAIVVRRCAMGKGYAKFGMDEIIKMALFDYNLRYVYWCVNPDNKRAVIFYDKNNYDRIDYSKIHICGNYGQKQLKAYYWYKYPSK